MEEYVTKPELDKVTSQLKGTFEQISNLMNGIQTQVDRLENAFSEKMASDLAKEIAERETKVSSGDYAALQSNCHIGPVSPVNNEDVEV